MKQDKSSTVSAVQLNYRSYSGNSGDTIYVHLISFGNGDQGEFHTTNPACPEFVFGQPSNYSIEPKFFKGTEVMRIKPIVSHSGDASKHQNNPGDTGSQNAQPSSGGQFKREFKRDFKSSPPRNENAIMAQHAISKSVELIASGVLDMDDLFPHADLILKWTLTKASMSSQDIINLPLPEMSAKPKNKRGK